MTNLEACLTTALQLALQEQKKATENPAGNPEDAQEVATRVRFIRVSLSVTREYLSKFGLASEDAQS